MTYVANDRHLRRCQDDIPGRLSPLADRAELTEDLLTRAQNESDPAARLSLLQQAVLANRVVASAVAGRYRGRGIDGDDLEQVAFLGLVKAARNWRPGRGPDFLAYAVPTMSGEIKRYFRDTSRTIRPPRWIQELQAQAHSVNDELTQRLGHCPSTEELSAALGTSADKVAVALAADVSTAPLSLDGCLGEEGAAALTDLLGTDDPHLDRVETHLWLRPALRELSPREKQIVVLRFSAGWTQDQIGTALGVSQMQVSRVLRAVLDQLRERLSASLSDDMQQRPA
jgi:RNA polymerase sigma-B factor